MTEPDQHRIEPDGSAIVRGDTALQSETLESLAGAVNYNDWLTSLALDHLGDDPIELGSGLGDYAATWLQAGLARITVTELDPHRLSLLQSRFAPDDRVEVASFDVLKPPERQHSAFVAFNVLEHISDHVGALAAAHSLVRPGGKVIMFVPAFEFNMSRFDREVGHVRRYTVASMRAAMQSAGLEPITVEYVNLPGVAAWFIGMRLLRMRPADGWMLRLWDRGVIPVTRRWEARHRAPFGQSVFAVARVPNRLVG